MNVRAAPDVDVDEFPAVGGAAAQVNEPAAIGIDRIGWRREAVLECRAADAHPVENRDYGAPWRRHRVHAGCASDGKRRCERGHQPEHQRRHGKRPQIVRADSEYESIHETGQQERASESSIACLKYLRFSVFFSFGPS